MDAFWERLSPGQILAVISICAGVVVAVMLIHAVARYQLQSLTDETALRREKQQDELELRTKLIERGGATGVSLESLLALEVPPTDPDGLNAELARRFGLLESSPDEIERALGRAMTAAPERKRDLVNVMDELLENGAPHEAILATIRALCGPAVVKVKETPVPAHRA